MSITISILAIAALIIVPMVISYMEYKAKLKHDLEMAKLKQVIEEEE